MRMEHFLMCIPLLKKQNLFSKVTEKRSVKNGVKTGGVFYAAPTHSALYPLFRNNAQRSLYTLKKLSLTCKEDALNQLMGAYLELKTYDEVHETLEKLYQREVKQIVFSNGTNDMLKPLVKNRKLDRFLDVLSVDDVKHYKPAPAAYSYAHEMLGVNRDEILFMSSNFWDITGAASYGFKTAWINRAKLPMDLLCIKPDFEFSNLSELLKHETKRPSR